MVCRIAGDQASEMLRGVYHSALALNLIVTFFYCIFIDHKLSCDFEQDGYVSHLENFKSESNGCIPNLTLPTPLTRILLQCNHLTVFVVSVTELAMLLH